ncbi:chemotaxis protein CheW [Roseovarius sp.]|uniref:chemotaxis protein CheW n=1 Tax=Roseovarius sp. TaxID=1486281 RepID=UPI003BAB9483
MTSLPTDPASEHPSATTDMIAPGRGRDAADQTIYGSFWLDGIEFALRAGVIREVVNEPATISAMPLSPRFMRGLINLRGMIIPVVDLRELLEFPAGQPSDRKVAIVEDGDHRIGLLVDRTGEVLKVEERFRVDFRPRDGQVKDVVVEGLLKLDGGERIVQILDPCEILSLEKVPRGQALSGLPGDQGPSRGRRFNCLSFQFGHTTCAIDLRHVKEVMDAPEIMDSILVHDCFIGITNLRGAVIPVADFRKFMGDAADLRSTRETPPKRKMLVVQTDGGPIGLLVYSIDSIIACFEDEVLQFTKLALPRADIVEGCLLGAENEIVMMLDYEVMKRDRILVDTARRCREVHPPEETASTDPESRTASARLTFIVFAFDKRFALETSQVKEVIDYPGTLLQPPYAIEFVDGVINLRGELISLINPRKLYGMPASRQHGEKVLIFRNDGNKYGIVVDTIDEIVITTENKVYEMSALNHRDTTMKIAEDVCGCIQSPTRGSVMILDTGALLRRCFSRAGGHALAPAPVGG